MANWVTIDIIYIITVSLWKAFLVLLVVRQSIAVSVNSILGTYCKGAVHKKGHNFFCAMEDIEPVIVVNTAGDSFLGKRVPFPK